MPFYIYAANVYCESCGEQIRKNLHASGHATADWDDEESYDSDDFPKGPFDCDEADTPQHCNGGPSCLEAVELDGQMHGAFLENDLTREGIEYVNDKIYDDPDSPVVKMWARYYGERYSDILPLPDDLGEPYWDRFDICEAHAVLESDWNRGGWLQERPANQRRHEATHVQLLRCGFRARPNLRYHTLTENGKAIYWRNVEKWGLRKPSRVS